MLVAVPDFLGREVFPCTISHNAIGQFPQNMISLGGLRSKQSVHRTEHHERRVILMLNVLQSMSDKTDAY